MKPKLINKDISSHEVFLTFDCGDLFKRSKVSKWDDIGKCMRHIDKFLPKLEKTSSGTIKAMMITLRYTLPNQKQLECDGKKYKAKDENLHSIDIVTFIKNTLILDQHLLMFYERQILALANICQNLKKLLFINCYLADGLLDQFSNEKKEEYIRNKLGQKEWFDIGMEIESKYRNKGKYKNDIDSLIYLRKHINPKIKFKFSADKTETKILKKHNLI